MKRFLPFLPILALACLLIHSGCAKRIRPIEATRIFPVDSGIASQGDNTGLTMQWTWRRGERQEKVAALVTPPEAGLKITVTGWEAQEETRGRANRIFTKAADAGTAEADKIEQAIEKAIRTSPEGYLRFNYIQSIRINPALMPSSIPLPGPPAESSGGKWRLLSLDLRVEFTPRENGALPEGDNAGTVDPGFSDVLSVMTLNPEQAEAFSLRRPPVAQTITAEQGDNFPPSRGASGVPTLQLTVKKEGMYRIDREVLVAGGINPDSVHPRHFHLYCGGKEIPMFPWGCLSETFTEADALLFHGFPTQDPYTDENVFRLYHDPAQPAKQMETTGEESRDQADPVTSHTAEMMIEEDLMLMIHSGNFLSIKGMRWVWAPLSTGKDFEQTFVLPGAMVSERPAEGTLKIYCHPPEFSAPARVEVRINDIEVLSHIVTFPENDQAVFTVSSEHLKETDNRLRIRILPAPGEDAGQEKAEAAPDPPAGVYVDFVKISYPARHVLHRGSAEFRGAGGDGRRARSYTIDQAPRKSLVGMETSRPENPRFVLTRKAGGQVHFTCTEEGPASYEILDLDLVPRPERIRSVKDERLADPANEAHYLIISYPDFIPAVRPLADWRRKQGLAVMIVDVEAVYDEFNHGILSPEAIKKFLAFATLEWKRPPAYVLLVGDSSSDFKNEARNHVFNFVPSYSHSQAYGGQDLWASDHWFTTFLGNDEYADVMLGRISVNNIKDAANAVNNIIHYEMNPKFGPWRATTAYVADDGPFGESAEELRREHTPAAFRGKSVYLEHLPLEDNFYLDRSFVEETRAKVSPAATAMIRDLFETGVFELSYLGHGSPNIWADERIWFGGDSPNSDFLHLENRDNMPFLVNLTCNSGAIDYPVPKWNICISEDAMRQEKGGAIGLFVPSGPGFSSSHREISRGLRRALYEAGIRRAGAAITAARSLYLLERHPLEIMQMFIFLGDPCLEFQLPRNRIALECDREMVRSGDLPAHVTVRAVSGMPENGEAWFNLHNPENEQTLESAVLKYSANRLEWSFEIPQEAAAGTWIVHCYAANRKQKSDAAGGVKIHVGEPFLKLTQPKAAIAVFDVLPGKPFDIMADVTNASPLPCEDARIEIMNAALGEPAAEPALLSLEPREERRLFWNVTPEAGINIFKIHLPQYGINVFDHTPDQEDLLIALCAPDDSLTSADIILSPWAVHKSYRQNGERVQMNLKGTLYNSGPKMAGVEIRLLSGTGEHAAVLKSQRVMGVTRRSPQTFTCTHIIDDPQREFRYTLEAAVFQGGQDQRPDNNRIVIEHSPNDMSDLTMDVSGIVLPNPHPTEGETIFVDVPVMNIGGAPADEIRVGLYDRDPSQGGTKIFSHMDTPDPSIPWLRPGETVVRRLRWDPVKNSGPQSICIVVDSLNRVAESREDNNMTTLTLHVRTRADLRPERIEIQQTENERKNLKARLVARVRNDGETPAKNVSVRFFKSRYQTPENIIGETLIPLVSPGDTAETVLEWALTEEEARFTYSPTFQVFLKGSSQRMSSVVEAAPVEETPGEIRDNNDSRDSTGVED